MADREKIIKGLEVCIGMDYTECQYCKEGHGHKDCIERLCTDALSMLKEQDNCENCAIAIEDRQYVVRCKDCKSEENYRLTR